MTFDRSYEYIWRKKSNFFLRGIQYLEVELYKKYTILRLYVQEKKNSFDITSHCKNLAYPSRIHSPRAVQVVYDLTVEP